MFKKLEPVDKVKTSDMPQLPNGYNPLSVIRGAMLHWVPVPFNGVPVWMELRCLNATQLRACGDLTLLSKLENSVRNKQDRNLDAIIEIRNIQEAIVKEICNKPKFDDIVSAITKEDFVFSDKKNEIDRINNIDKSSLSEKQRVEIEKQLHNLQLSIAFVLPEDAFGFLTAWALGTDVSDIKKLTKEMLLEAAFIAKKIGDAPHCHIDGVFSDRDCLDIDRTALEYLAQYEQEKKLEHSGTRRWIR
jgi:hypothetical protein